MKRIISLTIALCLVLGSFSFCFATATDWDTSDQANLQSIKNTLTSGGSLYSVVNTIKNSITANGSLYNIINAINSNINSALWYSDGNTNRTITWWIKDIDIMLENALGLGGDLNKIYQALYYQNDSGNEVSWIPDIATNVEMFLPGIDDLKKSLTNFYDGQTTLSQANRRANGHQNFFSSSGSWTRNIFDSNGDLTSENFIWQNGTPLGNIFGSLRGIGDSTAFGFNKLLGQMSSYRVYDDPSDYTSYYTSGISFADTALDQLGSIDMFIARLGYVLASDERMAAQEAAAANEEAVVDNFIDSSGDGSATPSDIGSISDLSSGYKDNFGSDASVSGIFNIFNSNNMGWFSQETANQLDTTTPTRRGSSFDTPLLDQQINDIYDQIGVKHD